MSIHLGVFLTQVDTYFASHVTGNIKIHSLKSADDKFSTELDKISLTKTITSKLQRVILRMTLTPIHQHLSYFFFLISYLPLKIELDCKVLA